MTALENHISGQKNQVEEIPHKKSSDRHPVEKVKLYGGHTQETKWGGGKNTWRGNSHINNGRKISEFKKEMRPWILKISWKSCQTVSIVRTRAFWDSGKLEAGTVLGTPGHWLSASLTLSLVHIPEDPNVMCLMLHVETLNERLWKFF